MPTSPGITPMPSPSDLPSVAVAPMVSRRAPSRGWKRRWWFRSLFLGLVCLNAWWAWGDWSPASMKEIDATISKGQLDDAERALRQRLRWVSADGDARMKLARLLVKRGDNLEGARQLHQVPKWWPSKPEATFLEGQAFKLATRARDATAAWQAILADDPLHPAPPQMFHGSARDLIAYYVLENRLDEAREALWRAYAEANSAERPGVLVMRLRVELERVDHEEAATTLRQFVAADPDDWDARRALAFEEHALGDAAAADRDIEACLKARPDDPLTWRARLQILNERGDLAGSRSAIAGVPKAAEVDAKVWLYRGLTLQLDGDRQGAFEAFTRAAKIAPNDPEILYKLGMSEQFLGQPARAKVHLSKSRKLHDAYAKLTDHSHEFQNEARKAPRDEAAYRKAIEDLARTCQELGWTREAEAWQRELQPG